MRRFALAFVAATLLLGCAPMQSKADQSVYFIEPKDGATVTSPFKVVFGVKGMAVEPAGDIKANSGHHHLLINLDAMKAGDAIPVDDTHLHFANGDGGQAAAGKLQADAAICERSARILRLANGCHDPGDCEVMFTWSARCCARARTKRANHEAK